MGEFVNSYRNWFKLTRPTLTSNRLCDGTRANQIQLTLMVSTCQVPPPCLNGQLKSSDYNHAVGENGCVRVSFVDLPRLRFGWWCRSDDVVRQCSDASADEHSVQSSSALHRPCTMSSLRHDPANSRPVATVHNRPVLRSLTVTYLHPLLCGSVA